MVQRMMQQPAHVRRSVLPVLLLLLCSMPPCGHLPQARGDLSDCIDATCRITAADGGRGTGCAMAVVEERVYVLTAEHVVGGSPIVTCEFWRDGHLSKPMRAQVVARAASADAALVVLPSASFGGMIPKTVPIAPADYTVRPGDALTSVGCANGSWSTGWKGHTLGYRGSDLHFLPTPANGRSGSAVFDSSGQMIVGLLRARTSDGNESSGIATSVQALHRALGEEIRTQCPGGVCPAPIPNSVADGEAQWRLSPYRQGMDERFRQIEGRQRDQQRAPSSVWPTLPMVPVSPPMRIATQPVDLSGTNERLDELGGKLDTLIEQLATEESVAPAGLSVPLAPSVSPADVESMKLAKEAKAEAESIRAEVVTARQDSAALREKVETLAHERDTLRQQFDARVAKVKAELGEDASRREIAGAYVKDLAAEKLGGTVGMTAGRLIGGALGLSAPVALAIGLAGFLVSRRIGKKLTEGEPLLIQKLFDRLGDKVDDLRDRWDDETKRRTSSRRRTNA